MTVQIELGTQKTGLPAEMDLEELLATRLLVQGNSGSGKSHLLRRILEQSAQWVQQVVIDPEGDFVSLAEEYGHVVVEADGSERDLQMIAARVRQHRVSVIFNLEGLDADRQMKAAGAFINGLFEVAREIWYPALVVVDEAQLFAPTAAGEFTEDARRASLGAMTNLMCRGRKRGLAGIIATQRLAKLAKNVAAEASNFLMGRTFLDIDMARASDLLGMERRQAETFRNLDRGQFVALGPALSRRPVQIAIGEVKTRGMGSSPKLMPLPEQPAGQDLQDLLYASTEGNMPPVEKSRPRPVDTQGVLRQLAVSSPPADEEPPGEAEDKHDEADITAAVIDILSQMMEDPEAAYRPVSLLYQDFQVRCRIARINRPPDLQGFRELLPIARAGGDVAEAASEDWPRATQIASGLPDTMRGAFLLIARAAAQGEPCPSNMEIATAYGTRSPGRARWLIGYMEENGFLSCSSDLRGNRIIGLPELGWQTAPGHPDGAEDRAS
ncbi:ATP-binding protein [Hoeflea prorocentri]|uniref:ATP-binding protein n=1 Tax=Hoeflea prorocentri TaxID=1922333 RepID=A0A9X3UJG1_9HYPH|nr:ATP-binding protein [Hoeflea prorocentri]MCY6382488.1 ATP-binding protein [Hoeflea prorocentri]MDA5400288.1 ATP-binding protein [Hoeflea prorocentri]